ncbi:hypothetical protein P171DRAFT_415786 [Karstenula rhodostoma CBS 690.94]|uniref:Rhodopsin domain-containing protein n=1 Tax=Karstenula rhodostoma CBS 690.94 TaxID=1392251 RepID=A0A9P4PEW3_9PLEO|nr:hypothetical protein P171DRAFT_415786 [Karstenula rhodostoma CBS 690.94]
MAHLDEIIELGELTLALVVVLLFLAWTTVALRMWVRLSITKSPGWDDATMLMTLCLFTCYCAFILTITLRSRAHRQFSEMEIAQSLVYVQLSKVFYILTTTFLKISLGLFFLRLLTKPWQTRLFHIILVISGVFGIFYFFFTLFVCGDPTKLADSLIGARAKHCAPVWFSLTTGYIYGIINVVADWIFTLIPIVILMDSTMDRRSKISVGIVMSFAAVGSISSIMRMVYLKGLLFEGSVSTTSIKATIWATAEPGTGIVAASAAILRPLFRMLYTDVRDKYRKSSKQDPTITWTTATTRGGDTESVIALTSVATKESRDERLLKGSIDMHEPWDARFSNEQARVGVGRVVVITAGQEVRTVPLRKK